MAKEAEYRGYAAEAFDLAQRVSSNSDKWRVLVMADAWLDLADRAHRLARRHAPRLKEQASCGSKLGDER